MLTAAPAFGSTVHLTTRTVTQYPDKGGGDPYTFTIASLRYVADAEEANDVTLSETHDPGAASWRYDIRDTGATIAPGENCGRVSDHEVRCESPAGSARVGIHTLDRDDVVSSLAPGGYIDGGDGDDRLTGTGLARIDGGGGDDTLTGTDVRGGPGDDTLIGNDPEGQRSSDFLFGGEGHDVLIGGLGDDHLRGGANEYRVVDLGSGADGGSDRLVGGPGNDTLSDDDTSGRTVGPDSFDGGEGKDHLSYEGRSGGLVVDLRTDIGGEPGENDRITSVESLIGGAGDDVLVGSSVANRLAGSGGVDRLNGLEGDDYLAGGAGEDALHGASGNDLLHGGEHADRLRAGTGNDELALNGDFFRDRAACDGGRDRVDADVGDVISPSCERQRRHRLAGLIAEGYLPPDKTGYLLAVRGGRTDVGFCIDQVRHCRGRVMLRARLDRRVITAGSAAFPRSLGPCADLCSSAPIKISRRVREVLRRRRQLPVIVVAVLWPGRSRGALPVRERATLRLSLRRP